MIVRSTANTRSVKVADLKVGDHIVYRVGRHPRLGTVAEILAPTPVDVQMHWNIGSSLYRLTIYGRGTRPVYRDFGPGQSVDVPVEIVR